MWTRIARGVLVLGLSLFPVFSPLLSAPVQAQGRDVCPEPNDTFQAACYLGPDSEPEGFISTSSDVDAYRIEVLDFHTDVHVELAMPLPYEIYLADWNGKIMAQSSPSPGGAALDHTVDIPGSYYIFIRSGSGAFSDSRPYTLFRVLTYHVETKIPDILFSSEFRPDDPSGAPIGTNQFSDEYSEAGGRYTIKMKNGGSYEHPGQAWFLPHNPNVTDFTMTVDARVVNGADSGVQLFFRKQGSDASQNNTYFVTVDTKDGQVKLSKWVDDELVGTDWVSTSAVNTGGGVNRIIVRAFQGDILVVVNGEEMFDVSDDSFRGGRIGFGAIAWEERPPEVNFDNILITTPTER